MRWRGMMIAVTLALGTLLGSPAWAQGRIELDIIEIEADVPRRVAQFFVQRDRLHYQPVEDRPSFLEELLRSVEDEPF